MYDDIFSITMRFRRIHHGIHALPTTIALLVGESISALGKMT